MADGFRILENGDSRITEASVFRITEKYVEVFSSLSATGSLIADSDLTAFGYTSLTGTSSIASIGLRTQSGASSFIGVGNREYSSFFNTSNR